VVENYSQKDSTHFRAIKHAFAHLISFFEPPELTEQSHQPDHKSGPLKGE